MAKNKLPAGIIIGAVAGGILSMLDPSTRKRTAQALSNTKHSISYYSRNPQELADRASQKADEWREIAEKIQEDIAFLSEKYEEVKSLAPELKETVQETKEAFTEEDQTPNSPMPSGGAGGLPEKKTM
ncbi:YtxH domain-containing protein [Jeotgalibacillus haloalkalitolerans]|uniref:YtxH domain-containing protein n=1 Tax=Jeotgalibacillus haloalkalitolerans TaxID=3104292 RepID=A0ABU5KQ74_9BACL|nr:YtxH domain-containing protein [Jeotgalibacillus sp. HH7-29]MDZ5713392.1 YtxH domain-containing protein [Jeotgalibacillus sp. HH7-29]